MDTGLGQADGRRSRRDLQDVGRADAAWTRLWHDIIAPSEHGPTAIGRQERYANLQPPRCRRHGGECAALITSVRDAHRVEQPAAPADNGVVRPFKVAPALDDAVPVRGGYSTAAQPDRAPPNESVEFR